MRGARQLELAGLLYRQIYYLANADRWQGIYLENRRKVLSRPKRRPWTTSDDRTMRRLYETADIDWLCGQLNRTRQGIYARAGILGLHKSADSVVEAGRKGAQHPRAVAQRFPKGHVPANKGKRRPGYAVGRMRETQFKKGESRNKMPLFSERLIDGYLYIKVAEVPHVPYTVNWQPLHILNWERANGRPMPKGHCLWFKDGNRLNIEPDNLELITRAENLQRNARKSWRLYPPEMKSAIRQLKKLKGVIREKQNGRSARSPVRHDRRTVGSRQAAGSVARQGRRRSGRPAHRHGEGRGGHDARAGR